MQVKVLLFAKARDVAGMPKCTLEFAEEASVSIPTALKRLLTQVPKLETIIQNCSLSCNEQFVLPSTVSSVVLKDGDTLGILPPVSGG